MSKKQLVITIIGAFLVVLLTVASEYESVQELRWAGSAHADKNAEAFIHWDEDDPPVVPTSCAKCHSNDGFLDFIGADGSAPWVVDAEAEPGIFHCELCHVESRGPWPGGHLHAMPPGPGVHKYSQQQHREGSRG